MAQADFLALERGAITDGSWFERMKQAWEAGRIGLATIRPEPSGDAELSAAIATMLASNGSYARGDRAIIHTRPAAVDMACETAHQLGERGIEATIVFGMASLGPQVAELIRTAWAVSREGGGPVAGDADATPPAFGAMPPEILDGVRACYRSLLEPVEASGHGHWIVPIGTAPDPDPELVPAIDFFMKVASRGLAPLGALRQDGRMASHDIWLYPTPLDVERLNEDLAPDRHWTLPEWRSLVFRSMAVGADELHQQALAIEGVQLTIHASEKGGRLHYQREDGTDFTYRVKGRPVILDCGRVGTNSLGRTEPYRSAITNQPTTEVFVAPIEDSLNGVIVYTIPERTVHGVIRAPYRIEVKDGQVTDVQAPDEESLRILRNYTGLEPYDGKALGGDEATAFGMRRVIAEMAIAGFNPAMRPEIESGRLRPVTGLVLTDEKLGDHQAFGSNDQFKGATPSTYGEEHVEHTDFVGSIERAMRLR